jgi:hypothetical protein
MTLKNPRIRTALMALNVLLLINLVGDYFNDYTAQLWWSNWFPAYAAFGVLWFTAIRRKGLCCQSSNQNSHQKFHQNDHQ